MSNAPQVSNVAAVRDSLLAQLTAVLESHKAALLHYIQSASKTYVDAAAECAKALNDLEERADILRAKILELS